MGIKEYNFLTLTLKEIEGLNIDKHGLDTKLQPIKIGRGKRNEYLIALQTELKVAEEAGEETDRRIEGIKSNHKDAEEKLDKAVKAQRSSLSKSTRTANEADKRGWSISLVSFGFFIVCFILVLRTPSWFVCDNGQQIDSGWVMDGEVDCSDGSDEWTSGWFDDSTKAETHMGTRPILFIMAIGATYMFHSSRKEKNEAESVEAKKDHKKKTRGTKGARDRFTKLDKELKKRLKEVRRRNRLPNMISKEEGEIEDLDTKIANIIDEIKEIDESVKNKMGSISHLIPYSEFLPE